MKLKEWGAFALLGLIWGSSFLWIKIAIREIGPFTLVAYRMLLGLLGLLVIMRVQKQSIPRNKQVLLACLFMGMFNSAIPFTLISWGETRIDSGLASILNSTVPLFTIIIAHFWLHDEKMTFSRLAGLIIGFAGIVVLVGRDGGLSGSLWGKLAVIAAAISYATAITFSRRYLRGQPPAMQSAMMLLTGDVLMWTVTPFMETKFIPALPMTWLAIAWLGLLGTCLAYVLFFHLINVWGPTRASLVSYLFPVIGLTLGIVFLNEVADWRLFAGLLLVVSGIAVVNLNLE